MNAPAACGEASRRANLRVGAIASLPPVFVWRCVRETRGVEPEDMPD
ncbi:MAG: hypothetical protein J0H27_04815 [Xanthomonadales bacterium]|nr:hypothetical protein [Xanthomonadales bacterium]